MVGSKDRYALVTGASSGIGYELAKVFARDGKSLVVVARSQDRLEQLRSEIEERYGTTVIVLPKDLSDPGAPQEIFSELQSRSIEVDVLVNNAGFGVYGLFPNTDLDEELRMIQVNATSLIHLTKLFLKGMVENRSGAILNVASMCSFFSTALESVYCATKALVLHFSEALANELKGSGVTVTCLCPGLAKTEFHERAHMMNTKAAKRKMMDAAEVAEAGYRALQRGKPLEVPGLVYKLGTLFAKFAPRSVAIRVVRSQHEEV
jgi:short-subunit dehydrogenase